MSATRRKAAPDTFSVSESMTEDGTMVVSPLGRFAEYEVVDYTDPLVEKRLAGLPQGETVRLELAPTAAGTDDEAASAARHRTMTDGGSTVDEVSVDEASVDEASVDEVSVDVGTEGGPSRDASTDDVSPRDAGTYVATRVLPGTGVGTV